MRFIVASHATVLLAMQWATRVDHQIKAGPVAMKTNVKWYYNVIYFWTNMAENILPLLFSSIIYARFIGKGICVEKLVLFHSYIDYINILRFKSDDNCYLIRFMSIAMWCICMQQRLLSSLRELSRLFMTSLKIFHTSLGRYFSKWLWTQSGPRSRGLLAFRVNYRQLSNKRRNKSKKWFFFCVILEAMC